MTMVIKPRIDLEDLRFREAVRNRRRFVHYCPEMDYMAVWLGTYEFREFCMCDFPLKHYSEEGHLKHVE